MGTAQNLNPSGGQRGCVKNPNDGRLKANRDKARKQAEPAAVNPDAEARPKVTPERPDFVVAKDFLFNLRRTAQHPNLR